MRSAAHSGPLITGGSALPRTVWQLILAEPMGEHRVHRPETNDEARAFTRAILADIEALEAMIERGLIEDGVRRVGIEQEMYLVDRRGNASPVGERLFDELADPRFQTELARFNLEANLDPQPLGGRFLRDMESRLADVVATARRGAERLESDVLLVGVLPTLRHEDTDASMMTPEIRYRCLNEACMAAHGGTLKLSIDGIERFASTFDSVAIEGANTSIQLHLQVGPAEAARLYNLSQLITAPLLAAAANSPVLFGRRLWHETRVAIFERAFDDRSPAQLVRGVPTRVGFGSGWLRGSLLELYRDNTARYPVMMVREMPEDPMQVLERGEIPDLSALMLHNGTVWRWNRACYGVAGGQAHLRIENRALPSGPTVLDQVANAALFYGLMVALDAEYGDVAERLSFHDARVNFLAAAQHALRARVTWLDGRRTGVRELLLEELIPAARSGLEQVGVPDEDRDRYLDVIEERVASGRTGARWLLDSLARVPRRDRSGACAAAVHFMRVKQRAGEPVHSWELLAAPDTADGGELSQTLADIMTKDLFTVRPNDVVDLATKVMEWRHIRHIPVEDGSGQLVGLLSTRELLRMQEAVRTAGDRTLAVKNFMDDAPPTAPPDITLVEGMQRLLAYETGCLLIVDHARLLGIVTERDLVRAAADLLEQSSSEA